MKNKAFHIFSYDSNPVSRWLVDNDPHPENIPIAIRERILLRDSYECSICGSRYDLVIDHIIPVSRGGKANMNNLQVLCRWCNGTKSNHLISIDSYRLGFVIPLSVEHPY